jgi:hypothetical protein
MARSGTGVGQRTLWSDSEAEARRGEAAERTAASARRRMRRLRPPPREEGSIPTAARSEEEGSGWPEKLTTRFHCGFGRSLIYLSIWDPFTVDFYLLKKSA